MKNNYNSKEDHKNHDNTFDAEHPETGNKQGWVSPQLKEFGNLSFVIKGISNNPGDSITNLTP